MAKFRVTLEFSVPDHVPPDSGWKGPGAELRVIQDVVLTPAICQLTSQYAGALQTRDKNMISYADLKLEIANSIKIT